MEKTIHNLFYDACRKTIVLLGLMMFAVNGWAQEHVDITPRADNDPLKDYYVSDGDFYDFTGTISSSALCYTDIESKCLEAGGTLDNGVYTYTDPGSDEEDPSDDTEYTIDYTQYTCWVSEGEYDYFGSFTNLMKVVEFRIGESDYDPLYGIGDYNSDNRIYNFTSVDDITVVTGILGGIDEEIYIDKDNCIVYKEVNYLDYDCWVDKDDYDSSLEDVFNDVYKVIGFVQGYSETDPLYDTFYESGEYSLSDKPRYNLTSDKSNDFPSWLVDMENGTYIDSDNNIFIGIYYSSYDCWVDEAIYSQYKEVLDEVFKDVYNVISFEAGTASDLFGELYINGEYDFTTVATSDIISKVSSINSEGKYLDTDKKIIYTNLSYSNSCNCWINDMDHIGDFKSWFGEDYVFVAFKAGDTSLDPFAAYYIQDGNKGYYDFTKIESYSSIKEDILSKITSNTWENADGNTISKIDFRDYDCLLHGYFLSEFGSDFSGLGFNIRRLSNTIRKSEHESEKNVPNVKYENTIENLYIVDFAELANLSLTNINSGYTMLSEVTQNGGPTVKKVTYSRNVGDGSALQWITMCLPFEYKPDNVIPQRQNDVHSETSAENPSLNIFKFDGKYKGDEVLEIDSKEYSKEANTMMFVPITDSETIEAGQAVLICTDAQTIEVVVNNPTFNLSTPEYGDMPETQEEAQNYNYYFRGCLTLNDGEKKATDLTPDECTMYKVSPTVNYVESTESSKVWVTDTSSDYYESDSYELTDATYPKGKDTDKQFKDAIQEKFENDYSSYENLEVLGVTITSKQYYYNFEYYTTAETSFEYPEGSTTDEEMTEEKAKEILSQYASDNSIEGAKYMGFEQNGSDGECTYTIKYKALDGATKTDTYDDSEPSVDSYLNSLDDFGKLYTCSLSVKVGYDLEYKYLSSDSGDGAQSYYYIATGTLLRCLDTGKSESFDSWIYPNRCYLVLPSSITGVSQGSGGGAKLRMVVKWSDTSDDVVAIEDIAIDENGNLTPKPKCGAIYSITGTLVNTAGDRSALAPGLYIQGGKKFVVR